MTIDEFARRVNTSARNVRAYQERGLLPPPILVGRTGFYDDSHVDRFDVVQRLQKEGFSLAGIRALLAAWDAGSTLDDVVGARRSLDAASSGVVDASTLFPLTKFQRPGVRQAHVIRRRCLQMVGSGHDRHVLITSPGGSGKSTLAAQLVSHLPSAWVSLEPADSEPGGFWTAILIALRTALPDFGNDLLSEIVGGAAVERVLVRLAEELATRRSAVSLVLDDLHEIDDATVVRQLGWLLGQTEPSICRIVMCSRTRPALPIAQLAMNGRLFVLGTQEVSFDEFETRELLLDRLRVPLTTAESDEIAAGADGWVAAIYLAGLALRTGAPTADVIGSLSVPDRRVQQYFADEILHAIEPKHLEFLQEISVLDRFTAELCDAVRGSTDSEQILGELDDNMFVLPLDAIGFWQRLHHTLAAVLRARAAAAGDANVALRQRRAAEWHMQHDRVPEAIDYYMRAGAHDEAVRVIGSEYPRFINISHHGGVVERWLEMLPRERVTSSPELSFASAGVAGLSGDAQGMEHWLSLAEALSGNDVHSRATADFMRGCFNFGEIEAALRAVRSSFVTSRPGSLWYPMQGATLALLQTWVEGPSAAVLYLVDEVLADDATVHQPIALIGLWALRGLVQAAHGEPGATESLCRAAEIRGKSRIDRVPQAANTWSSTAWAHRLLGDVERAAADSFAGYQIVANIERGRDATGSVVPVLVELAHARRLQGRADEARRYVAEAERRLAGISGPGLLPAMLAEAAAGL
ncbi:MULTISPECIES: MerR family transcriptional regulator [unclassified Mycolicibacterium]|uniref:MerR family transcriptional regulator n=1 Tax=unclassified Mycolicibacterium TaxID=2636767 RepID=UPI002EDA79BF